MRAKSIKNKARVNAELSPAELKVLLKKAQRDQNGSAAYIGLLEREVGVWRAGGTVDPEAWATLERALGLAPGDLAGAVGSPSTVAPALRLSAGSSSGPRSTTPTPSRGDTPVNPLERVGLDSRSQTPGLDERDEFLRRENELMDQLSRTVSSNSLYFRSRSIIVLHRLMAGRIIYQESCLSTADKSLQDLREEIAADKAQDETLSRENKLLSGQVGELRLQLERLLYESKEAAITTDALKDQNGELTIELDEFKVRRYATQMC